MGYWKDVAYDISRGMSKEKAIEVNAVLRNPNSTSEDRMKAKIEGEWDIKLNTMQ